MQNNIRRVQSMRKKREDNIILKAQYIIQYTLWWDYYLTFNKMVLFEI